MAGIIAEGVLCSQSHWYTVGQGAHHARARDHRMGRRRGRTGRPGRRRGEARRVQVPIHSCERPGAWPFFPRLKMAMGTRNPSTRRVLPDKKTGMEQVFYPWVRYWAKSFTRWAGGYGCGCIVPIPVYPRVKNTRSKKLN